MDEDLVLLDRDALIVEVTRLRAAIREHRDSSEHELCWHHPKLWGVLPEKVTLLRACPRAHSFCEDASRIVSRSINNCRMRHGHRTSSRSSQSVLPSRLF